MKVARYTPKGRLGREKDLGPVSCRSRGISRPVGQAVITSITIVAGDWRISLSADEARAIGEYVAKPIVEFPNWSDKVS